MEERWCSACGQRFLPRAQCPRQTYCANPACQKTRKLLWQTTKRRTDHDYYENQAKANRAWTKRNPQYWISRRSMRVDRSLKELGVLVVAALHQMLDASSRKSSRRNQSSLVFAFQFSVGQDDPMTVKVRVEVKAPKEKSSSTQRQETT